MARNKYLVIYPDGSRLHVSDEAKREMQREGLLQQIDARRFFYLGKPFLFHALADLGLFLKIITTTKRIANYPGFFIREFRHKRRKEVLESPEHMEIRLKENGLIQ